MIAGNPYKFAIGLDIVDSWNSKESFWINGIFTFYIDGEALPKMIDAAELKTSMGVYDGIDFSFFNTSEKFIHQLNSDEITKSVMDRIHGGIQGINAELFKKREIVDLTCTVMENQYCWAFLYKNSISTESIIWTKDGVSFSEKILDFGYSQGVIEEISSSWRTIIDSRQAYTKTGGAG